LDFDSKIYLAGHEGLVGSNILNKLKEDGYKNIITKSFKELDLRNQQATEDFFKQQQPEYVFLAAAKVGGIMANSTYTAEFIYDNLMIAANMIHASYKYKVKKLLNLGSSCIYPKMAPQPLKEEYLLSDYLEPTNEPYAIAKIAAIKLCRYYNEQYGTNFISVMPTNLYGPGDNFNLETSHVLPALIRKFHEAKVENQKHVEIWGTGEPYREFMFVSDLAEAVVFLMKNCDYKDVGEFINIGTGKDIQIKDLAVLIKDIVGFEGDIKFDTSKPDGTPKKLLDISRINSLDWQANVNLRSGIEKAYNWYLSYLDKNVNVKFNIDHSDSSMRCVIKNRRSP
jgi:GDP-L-fucose synthase